MKLSLLVIFFLAEIIVSCRGQSSNNNRLDSVKFSDKNFRTEIPLRANGEKILSYLFAKQEATQLGLDSLELGFDSLQLRIWFGYSSLKQQLIIIKRRAQKWSGQLVSYTTDWGPGINHIIVSGQNFVEITPLNGWDNLMRKLIDLKITEIKNEEGGGGADGVSYSFEVATKNYYRFYKYWSPETTMSKSKESRNIVNIIELLEREFNFKRIQK